MNAGRMLDRGPALTQTLTLRCAARPDAGLRILRQDLARRNLWIRPPRLLDLQRQARLGERGCRLIHGLSGQRRNHDLTRPDGDSHRRRRKNDIGQHQRYAEQEQLARAPYARRKCHES